MSHERGPTTAYIVVGLVFMPLAWEVYALISSAQTISQTVHDLAQHNIFVGYVLAVLVGHFFITPPTTLAQRLSEAAEVALILAVGAVVFLIGMHVQGLSWWMWALFLLVSMLMGGFGWTIDD